MVAATDISGSRTGDTPKLSVWDGVSEISLARALVWPTTDCVEVNAVDQGTSRMTRRQSNRRIRLTITTGSAYRYSVAEVFGAAIEARLRFSQDLREKVVTAVHEALMNATLHGNLGLESGLRDSLRGLVAWYEMIETRLASAQISQSLIFVDATWTKALLRIVVGDSGRGYKSSAVPTSAERQAGCSLGSGRGLLILETLCDDTKLLRGGTAIELGFRLSTD